MGEKNLRLVLIVHLSAIAHSMFTVTFILVFMMLQIEWERTIEG